VGFHPNDLANSAWIKLSKRLSSTKPVKFDTITHVYRYLSIVVRNCFNDLANSTMAVSSVENDILDVSRPVAGGKPKKKS